MNLLITMIQDLQVSVKEGIRDLDRRLDQTETRMEERREHARQELSAGLVAHEQTQATRHAEVISRIEFLEDWRKKLVYGILGLSIIAPTASALIVAWLVGKW